MKMWNAIETAPDPAAEAIWRQSLGEMFDPVAYSYGWLRKTTSVTVVKEWELSLSKMCIDVARAFRLTPNTEKFKLYHTNRVAFYEGVPIILTIQPDQGSFLSIVQELVELLPGRFILLAPTNRFADDKSQKFLKQAGAPFFDLESNLRVWPNGTLQAKKTGEELFSRYFPPISKVDQITPGQNLEGVLKDIHCVVVAGRTENRESFEKIGRGVEAVAKGNFALGKENEELREAKARLEKMLAEGCFAFTKHVDARAFKVICTILAKGDVAKASRELEMPDSTLREEIKSWSERGKAYVVLADLVRWRKSVGQHKEVPLNDAILLETSKDVDHPGLLSDVLDELLSMTERNWADKVEVLAEMLRPHVPR